MLVKKDVVLLAIMVGLFLIAASWPYLVYKIDNPTSGITGDSVGEATKIFYDTSSAGNRILILLQIFLLIIVVIYAFFILKRSKERMILSKKDYIAKDGNKRSRTDLDILYGILKIKKAIGIDDIARTFKVDPEIALGWSKVLENGDLAEIDYPRFRNPVLKLPEEVRNKENGEIEIRKDIARKIKKSGNTIAKKVKGKNSKVKKVERKIKEKVVKKNKTSTRKSVLSKKGTKVSATSGARKSVPSKKGTKVPSSSGEKVSGEKKIAGKGKKR